MTTPHISDLDDFRCQDCGHRAVFHVNYTGPCSDCWRELLTICKHFRLKDEDVELAEATLDQLLEEYA